MSITKLTTPVKPNDIIKKVNEVIDSDELKAPIATTVTNVSYNSTSKKIQKTINGSTTDVTPVVTSVNGSTGDVTVTADNTFVAIRNTTTYDEVEAAVSAKKIVFATANSNAVIPTAVLVGIKITSGVSSFVFSSISDDIVTMYELNDNDVWSSSTVALAESTDLPTITLNGTATTTPSFYAPTTAGTTGYYLKSSGTGAPVWGEAPGGGGSTVGYTPNLTAGAEAGTITIDSVDTKIYVPNVAYATSDSQNTYSLTATVAGSQPFTLTTGAMVAVKFTYEKPYQAVQAPLTLNVNSTGAKAIFCNGSSLMAIIKEKSWGAGDMVLFVYDGTYWQWVGKDRVASTSEYGIVRLSTATDSASTDQAATPSAVKAAYDLANGKSAVTLNGTASATPSFYAPTTAGTAGYVLTSSGSGAPTWAAAPSGGGGVLVVNVEEDDGVCTADKTYAQIMAAINNGQDVYAVMWMYVYQLDQINTEDNFVSFSYVGFYNQYVGDDRMFVDTITIDASSVTRDIQLQSESSGGGAFVINISYSGSTTTADKTYAQITQAISDGKYVYAYDGWNVFRYTTNNTEDYAYTFTTWYIDGSTHCACVQEIQIGTQAAISNVYSTDQVPGASNTLPVIDGTAAIGSATTYARADHVHPKITQTISMTNNVITLSGSDGTSSTVTLPVYNGGVQTV